MSRYRLAGQSTDRLPRPHAAATARSERHISSDALLSGLRAIAPRLGLVFLIAGALQMTLRLTGH